MKDNEVFVFGSNAAGRHGAGAAKFAAQHCGAIYGQGEGLQGQSYAIPTKNSSIRSLFLTEIAEHVEKFIGFAYKNQHLQFIVSRIGCGLAGFTDEEIAPLFKNAPANCDLPGQWVRLVRNPSLVRLVIAGSRNFNSYPLLKSKLDFYLGGLTEMQRQSLEVISGGARVMDALAERYAIENGLNLFKYPDDWNQYGKSAVMTHNAEISRHGTHLIAFWDGVSTGTKMMIETAKTDGLLVRVVQVKTPELQEKDAMLVPLEPK